MLLILANNVNVHTYTHTVKCNNILNKKHDCPLPMTKKYKSNYNGCTHTYIYYVKEKEEEKDR